MVIPDSRARSRAEFAGHLTEKNENRNGAVKTGSRNPPNQKQAMRKTTNKSEVAAPKRRPALTGLKIQRILVPMDFSGLSRQALNLAVPLARKYRAKITLVHVVPPLSPVVTFPGDGSFLPIPGENENLLKATRSQLSKLADQLLPKELQGKKNSPRRQCCP